MRARGVSTNEALAAGPGCSAFRALGAVRAAGAAAAALLLAAGCAQQAAAPAAPAASVARPAQAAPAAPAWAEEARKAAMSVPPRLITVLQAEIDKAGPAHAIGVCRERAPELARAASAETGWQVRRVSLRNRNPRAVPDAWERTVLEDFDRRAAAGESPATLEKAEAVRDASGKVMQRYMRALPTQPLCLQCHGPAEQLQPAVAERLRTLYPADRGVGYRTGEIRGAMTLAREARP